MFGRLVSTNNDISLTVLRVVLGFLFFAHGAQKMFGWYGGYGFDATMGAFTTQMGIAAPLAFLAIAAEFFGGLGLLFGLLTRIAAFGILSVMTVAIFKVHLQFGLFMNWAGSQKGEGYEYHLLAIAIAIGLMLRGGGAFSLDYWLARRAVRTEVPAGKLSRGEAMARR